MMEAASAGVVQEIVGDGQICGGQAGRQGVLVLFHRQKDRREAVGAVGVFRRLAEHGGLFLKAFQRRRAKHR
jgi:hypothetical protein